MKNGERAMDATPTPKEASEKPTQVETFYQGTADTRDPLAVFLRDRLNLEWASMWLVALLIYGPLEKLIIPSLGGYLNLSTGIKDWVPHVESLLTGFVEFPFFLAFYVWSGRRVIRLLERLRENQVFPDPKEFDDFASRMRAAMDQRRYSLISLLFALGVMLVMHTVVWGPNAVVPPWFGDRLYARIISLILLGIVAYTVSQVIIRETLTGIWMRRLWRELGDQLTLHPYHPDGAGGLGAIGQHGVTFFYYIMMLLLFILMATILPSFLEARAEEAALSVRFWSPLVLTIWVIYLITIPLLFVLLMWPPHEVMGEKRNERLSVFSKELDEQLQRAEDSLDQENGGLDKIRQRISDLKGMRTVLMEDYPVWPINTQTKRLFGLTSALPTVYSLLTVIFELLL